MFVDFHIVGSLHCQFYGPVYPFEIFWIETKVIFVDRKWWLVEQKFITKTGVHCVSLVKMIFKQKCGKTIYSYEAQPTIVNSVYLLYLICFLINSHILMKEKRH